MITTRRLQQWERQLAGDGPWDATGADVLAVVRELLARREGASDSDLQAQQARHVAGLQRSADVWLAEAQQARRALADIEIERAHLPSRRDVDVWIMDMLSYATHVDPDVSDSYCDAVEQAGGWLRAVARDDVD